MRSSTAACCISASTCLRSIGSGRSSSRHWDGSGFLALYVLSLLGGSLLALTLEPTAHTVGASGALFGLFGALYVLLTRKGISPWSTGIGGLIVVNLIITFTIPIISVGGHVGGLIAGGLAVLLLEPARDGWRSKTALAVVGAVLAASVLFGAAYLVALQSTPF